MSHLIHSGRVEEIKRERPGRTEKEKQINIDKSRKTTKREEKEKKKE